MLTAQTLRPHLLPAQALVLLGEWPALVSAPPSDLGSPVSCSQVCGTVSLMLLWSPQGCKQTGPWQPGLTPALSHGHPSRPSATHLHQKPHRWVPGSKGRRWLRSPVWPLLAPCVPLHHPASCPLLRSWPNTNVLQQTPLGASRGRREVVPPRCLPFPPSTFSPSTQHLASSHERKCGAALLLRSQWAARSGAGTVREEKGPPHRPCPHHHPHLGPHHICLPLGPPSPPSCWQRACGCGWPDGRVTCTAT